MRAKNYLRAVLSQLVYRGQSRSDTVVVGDFAVFQRYVEVNAHQHLFALYVQILDILLIELSHSDYFLS